MAVRGRCLATTVLCALAAALVGCGGGGPQHDVYLSSSGPIDYLALVEDPGNPVVNPGTETYYPTVLQDGGLFLMWASSSGVSMFTSADGIVWGPATVCSGLPAGAHHCQVIKNPDTGLYEMWYWNSPTIYSIAGLAHATSSNGVTWTGAAPCTQLPAPNRLVTGVSLTRGTYGPCQVLYNPGGLATLDPENPFANRYVMYYDQTTGGSETIGLAASADGVLFGVPSALEGQPVLGLGPAGAWDDRYVTFCGVFENADGYHMYYSGGRSRAHEGIGYAHSTDGIAWAKHPTPILHITDGVPWRSTRTYTPSLVVCPDKALVYFSGEGTFGKVVGLATLALQEPDTAPPTVVLAGATPSLLWPANRRPVQVTVTGSVTDDASGVSQATLTVDDEYNELDQTIDLTGTLGSDGSLATTLTLTAWRNGNDRDGRRYILAVTASDEAGNTSDPVSALVICPHDQRK